MSPTNEKDLKGFVEEQKNVFKRGLDTITNELKEIYEIIAYKAIYEVITEGCEFKEKT